VQLCQHTASLLACNSFEYRRSHLRVCMCAFARMSVYVSFSHYDGLCVCFHGLYRDLQHLYIYHHLTTTAISGGGLVYQLLCVGQSRSVHPAVRWLCIALTGSLVKAERTGASMRYSIREEFQSLISLNIYCIVFCAMFSVLLSQLFCPLLPSILSYSIELCSPMLLTCDGALCNAQPLI
jgi:hypothetical protein